MFKDEIIITKYSDLLRFTSRPTEFKSIKTHYFRHIDRHQVLFLCRPWGYSRGPPQDPSPSMDSPLWVSARLLQPLRPARLLH